jgi:hypothetical protein
VTGLSPLAELAELRELHLEGAAVGRDEGDALRAAIRA